MSDSRTYKRPMMAEREISNYHDRLMSIFDKLKEVTKVEPFDKLKLIELLNSSLPTNIAEEYMMAVNMVDFKRNKKEYLKFYIYKDKPYMCLLVGYYSIEKTLKLESKLSLKMDIHGKYIADLPRNAIRPNLSTKNSKDLMGRDEYGRILAMMSNMKT
jgi:hypothetical protein